MANEHHEMEIHFYLIDGTRHQFFVDEAGERERIMASVQPNRIFSEAQKQIMIAGTYFMGGFFGSAIARMDLVLDDPPFWRYPAGVKEMTEIQEEYLERRAKPRRSDPRRSEVQVQPGERIETYADFGLAGGWRLCVKLSSEVHGAIDQRTLTQQLFSGTGFHASRLQGGIVLVNSAHITRWAMYPGPAQAPTNSWRAHRIDPHEWGGAPSMIFKKMDLTLPEEGEGETQLPPGKKHEPKDPIQDL